MSNSQDQLFGKELIEFIGATSSEQIYLFGVGKLCKFALNWFKSKDIPLPAGICDNNTNFHGKSINGVSVISFEQAFSNTTELKVIITDLENSSTIEQQLLNVIDKSQVFDLSIYFKKVDSNKVQNSTPTPPITKAQAKFDVLNKRYTDSLRGLNNENFPLKKPEDITEYAKQLVQHLKDIKEAYLRGENFYVDKEKTVLAQDLFSRGCYKGVYRLGGYGSHLIEITGEHVITKNKMSEIEDISKFSNFLKAKEKPFLFMQLPVVNKLSPNATNLPEGVTNTANIRADYLLEGLKQNKVNTLDYRQVMIDNNIDFLDSFFKTDTHWTPRAAFKATKTLCEEIQKLIDINIDWDKLDIDNYHQIVYPSIFLGSFGKLTGSSYSSFDDFELILPKYDTEYTWFAPQKSFVKNGSAEEALLYPLQLDWNISLNQYAVYSLMHEGHTTIKNHKSNNNKKILFLNDSFSNPIASFIAPQFSECHFLDLRGVEKNLSNIVYELSPDVVVMIYATPSYVNKIFL